MTIPLAMAEIEKFLRKLLEASVGLPGPHAETHLQGGSDAFTAPGVPSTIDPNLGPSAGAATNYARADVRPAIDLKLTTKGDSLTRTAGAYVREAVGADTTLLQADSAQATGRKWATIASIFGSLLTTKGDLLTRDATTPVRKGVGGNALELTADSSQADGLRWGPLVVRPAALAADQNDYTPGAATVLFLSGTAARTITGLLAGLADGADLTLWNNGSFTLTLAHENAGSAVANRFTCQGGLDVAIKPGFAALLTYDLTAARWRAREG